MKLLLESEERTFHGFLSSVAYIPSISDLQSKEMIHPVGFARRAALPIGRRCRQAMTMSTYYDSQSGIHVPIHNDAEISVYLEWCVDLDANGDTLGQWIHSMKTSGAHGAILSTQSLVAGRKEHLEATKILASSSPEFELFTPALSQNDIASYPAGVIPMFDYAETSSPSVMASLSDCVASRSKSCLWIGDLPSLPCDPIELANGIASLIDSTGGCEFVWLCQNQGRSRSAEDTVKLCEELSYLDVRGPTMKSRLVVDLRHAEAEETAEECLLMGVNKFVVEEDGIHVLKEIAQRSGKDLRT